ncbi:endonuclease III domain-containing protein [Limosilactobacillus caecicola]|uniref:endonuclease III domain-containing protein n=1 Tax=Limosilactobacillus caecicola TaxID=2941332 RepID=UPI00203A6DB5|nr:deoxyribonuclease I [Limosilactobacillus caecicola]
MELTVYQLYHKMLHRMGPTGWWPADSKNEIICGAILIQNTNSTNAERAVENLRQATNFAGAVLAQLDLTKLQELVRPAGFFKNKSRAIHEFFRWYQKFDFIDQAVTARYGSQLRATLLKLRGIGNETADVLRTYVFEQPVFVSDKYARTLFTHLGVTGLADYQSLAKQYQFGPEFSVPDAQEFHGLIDEFGKQYFRGQDRFSASFLAGDTLKLQ